MRLTSPQADETWPVVQARFPTPPWPWPGHHPVPPRGRLTHPSQRASQPLESTWLPADQARTVMHYQQKYSSCQNKHLAWPTQVTLRASPLRALPRDEATLGQRCPLRSHHSIRRPGRLPELVALGAPGWRSLQCRPAPASCPFAGRHRGRQALLRPEPCGWERPAENRQNYL